MTDLRRVAADIEILSRAALTPWPPKEAQMDELSLMERDEPHDGCLERACECVQADLAAAEKGRDYYSEMYATTGQQLRGAVAALEAIREQAGAVCPEYEVCAHPACQASYAAWALADEYLRRQ